MGSARNPLRWFGLLVTVLALTAFGWFAWFTLTLLNDLIGIAGTGAEPNWPGLLMTGGLVISIGVGLVLTMVWWLRRAFR